MAQQIQLAFQPPVGFPQKQGLVPWLEPAEAAAGGALQPAQKFSGLTAAKISDAQNEAFSHAGLNALAIRDYRKTQAALNPGEYLTQRLQRLEEYMGQMRDQYTVDLNNFYAETGDVEMAKTFAQRKLESSRNAYLALLEAAFPDASDSISTVNRRNAANNVFVGQMAPAAAAQGGAAPGGNP